MNDCTRQKCLWPALVDCKFTNCPYYTPVDVYTREKLVHMLTNLIKEVESIPFNEFNQVMMMRLLDEKIKEIKA